jgi:hypothetical protein
MNAADGDVSAWLDGVRAGLGKHADVFVEYGASTLADLRELDVDDINQLTVHNCDLCRAGRHHCK